MNTPNDGGRAFPNEGFNGWGEPERGMSLRDYFAVHCDQPGEAEIVTAAGGKLEDGRVYFNEEDVPGMRFADWWRTLTQTRRFDLYAQVRFALADAMLRARGQS